MKKLSTKHYVCILRDGSKFFLDDKEAEIVKQAIKSGADFLEIGDSLVSKYDFQRLVSSESYEESEKIKRGERKCSCGKWIPPGKTCGLCE